jgi:Skp family chaperone for outer membrane proteins
MAWVSLNKILIFLNLVFSVLAFILIIQVYATRTSWRAAYEKLNSYYTVSEANAKACRTEVDEVKKKKDEEIKLVQKDLNEEKAKTEKLTGDLDKAKAETLTERAKLESQSNNATASNAELNRRQDETRALAAQLNKANATVADLQKQSKQLTDEKMQAVINYNSEHDRLVRLLETHRQLSQNYELAQKKLASLGANSNTPITRNPPPEDVNGIVTETDTKTGMVTISIGTDAGVNVGNTLEVFRIKPEPKYLGTIRILDAQAHQAVGKLTGPARYGPIAKGDIAASKIMTTMK